MLTLDEYILKRKTEDHLNEFDSDNKLFNIRVCIDYIFEYFEQYLPLQGADTRTPEENERLTKYEKAVRDYKPEVRDWLINIRAETGHQINRTIIKYLEKRPGFYFICEESEFRSISYECYAELVKARPCLRNQTEELYEFIKEHHRIANKKQYEMFGFPVISPTIDDWLEFTYQKYGINIYWGLQLYLDEFTQNPQSWPKGTRMKSKNPFPGYEYDYNYTKQNNRFNINIFYGKYGSKPFFKGKKKAIEIVMLQYCCGTDNEFFNEYLNGLKDY